MEGAVRENCRLYKKKPSISRWRVFVRLRTYVRTNSLASPGACVDLMAVFISPVRVKLSSLVNSIRIESSINPGMTAPDRYATMLGSVSRR